MADIKAAPLPSQEYINECVSYDSRTGLLTWKVRPLVHFKNIHGMNTFNSKFSGKSCGHLATTGYIAVHIGGKLRLAHRVIWKLITGIDPGKNIDHKDTNKTNNRFDNLRLSTKQQNAFNQGLSSKNKTGFKGVSFDKNRNKYFSCIEVNGKTRALGRFETPEQAHLAYCNAAIGIHGQFLRTK